LEAGNSRRELNLANMLDEEAIRSGIRLAIGGLGTYEFVHYLDGRALSSSSNGDVFFFKMLLNGSIRPYNISNRH